MATPVTHASFPLLVRRSLRADPVWRRWTAAWVGGSILGIANGVIRERVYKDRVGEVRANQVAAAILVALLALYFGHWVDGKSWSELFDNYNVAAGRLWLLALIWIGAGPAVIRRLRRQLGGSS